MSFICWPVSVVCRWALTMGGSSSDFISRVGRLVASGVERL